MKSENLLNIRLDLFDGGAAAGGRGGVPLAAAGGEQRHAERKGQNDGKKLFHE